MLIQRYLTTYWYFYLSQISRRSLQNLYLYYRVYTCSEVPVGITEITKRILIMRNLFIYGSTCKYYKTYAGTSYLILYYEVFPYLTKLILVLLNLFLYFRSYTSITELIHVFQILYLSYRAYTCLTILYLYYGTCTCLTDLIRSLFWYKSTRMYYTNSLYEGTRRYYWTYISRRAHICTYLRFIYLYRNTYTCTCPYHRHILIKSLIGIIEFLCVRRYP